MKKQKFDVLVIGSGVAGKTVAEECAKAGMEVAVAEKREFGGTCSNRGCDPKKVLLGPSELIQGAMDYKAKNIVSVPKVNWKNLQKFKKSFTTKISEDTKKDFKEKNITVFNHSPKFTGNNTLKIKDVEVKADKIVIATGLIPRALNIKGDKFLKFSEDFMSLKKLPKRIIFIGAGYIGLEFAQLAARMGSKVTIIDHSDSILKGFDADLSQSIERGSKDLGIKFRYRCKVTSVQLTKKKKKYVLNYEVGGKSKSETANLIFNTSGRIPAVQKLNLEKGNIEHDDDGILVDDYLRSKSNNSVYACGDVSSHGVPLSPLSGYEGSIVAKNLIEGNKIKIKLPVVPSVVFTIPNLATVGYSEEEALSRYKNITIKHEQVSDWFNNKRINGAAYAYKILINKRTDEIVGAHILGHEANEIINLFAMAINHKIKAKQIKEMIFTYPSWSNDVKSMLS